MDTEVRRPATYVRELRSSRTPTPAEIDPWSRPFEIMKVQVPTNSTSQQEPLPRETPEPGPTYTFHEYATGRLRPNPATKQITETNPSEEFPILDRSRLSARWFEVQNMYMEDSKYYQGKPVTLEPGRQQEERPQDHQRVRSSRSETDQLMTFRALLAQEIESTRSRESARLQRFTDLMPKVLNGTYFPHHKVESTAPKRGGPMLANCSTVPIYSPRVLRGRKDKEVTGQGLELVECSLYKGLCHEKRSGCGCQRFSHRRRL